MKNLPKFIFLISYLLCLIFLINPSSVLAKEKLSSFLPRDQVVAKDYFSAGEKVTLSGTVEGDAYLAGATVLVDGVVKGDLIVVGGEVTVRGEVGQDLRIVGGIVDINGRVGRNVSFTGGVVHIGEDGKVTGNLHGFFINLEHLGQVMGDMNLIGSKVYLDGKTERNVYAKVDSVIFGDNALISGDLTYESKRKGDFLPGAQIIGRTTYKPLERLPSLSKDAREPFGRLREGVGRAKRSFSFISFLVALVVGIVLLRVFPKRMAHMVEILGSNSWKCLGIGFFLVIATPVVVVLFAISVIGIPLSLVSLFAFFIFVYFAKIIVGYSLGQTLLRTFSLGERRGWALFAGLFIYYLLRFVPIIGPLITLTVLFCGLGVFALEMFYIYKRLRVRRFL